MNFPLNPILFGAEISTHLVTELLAFFVGFRYYLFLRKQHNDLISSDNRLRIVIGATAGALLGSRLLGGLENLEEMQKAENLFLYFYSNKTVLGGFLGGLWGVELAKKIIGESHSSGDLFTFPIILGLMIGRIGCFSMGVYEPTYGLETSMPWGMDLGDGRTRHVTALYEMLFLAVLWFSIYRLEKKYAWQEGGRFKIFIIAYLLFRFLISFLKPEYKIIGVFSTIQLASLLGLLYYSKTIFNLLSDPSTFLTKKTIA
jgi:phosphatidylglycerol---prolipoprotein diacylglyceryl transferase